MVQYGGANNTPPDMRAYRNVYEHRSVAYSMSTEGTCARGAHLTHMQMGFTEQSGELTRRWLAEVDVSRHRASEAGRSGQTSGPQ